MDSNELGRVRFDANTLPERDRFPAFREQIFRHIVHADVMRLDDAPFRGVVDMRHAGPVKIGDISLSSADIVRDDRFISDGDDDIVIQLCKQGRIGAVQGKNEVQVSPRDGFFIDNTKPARIRAENDTRFFTLMIPRTRLKASWKDTGRIAGTKPSVNIALLLLLGYLTEIVPQDLSDPRAAALVGNYLIDLVICAGEGAAGGRSLERAGVRAARLAAILRRIENAIRNPHLSAAAVAKSLGVTPRYVHLLLEETGRSFTHHVLERRLERAAALLRDPQWDRRKVVDIAAEAGFTDLSYFNRSFRRRYGATPSDIRAAAAPR